MPLVNRLRLGTSLAKELFEKLHELHGLTRIPISKLMDEAVEDLIKKYQTKSS